MLTQGDAQLAARDSALPGLATLLDSDQLLELLKPELSLDWQQLSFTPSYIRYKPATSCLVGFSGSYQQHPIHFYARLHPPEEREKAAKPLLRPILESALGPGALLLEKPCLLFMFLPNDHVLRVIQKLNEPSKVSRILNKLLPQLGDLPELKMSILRYKPERRCVSQIRIASEPRFLLKAHDSGFLQRSTGSAEDFRRDAAIKLRPRLACLPDKGLALHPWVPGSALGSQAPEGQIRRVGRMLARLHGLNSTGAASTPPAAKGTWDSQLGEALNAIATIAPDQHARAQELRDRIQVLWSEQPTTHTDIRCRIHGDFSGDQVIINGDQICFIDFDRTRISHPIHDLGSFLARLHREQISGGRSTASLSSHSHALIEGYFSASRWPITALVRPAVALHLLLLATEAFRLRQSSWPEILNETLTRIELILDHRGNIHAA